MTFIRAYFQRGGGLALPGVPDTEHAVLAPRGHDVLLVWMSGHAVQGNSVPSPGGQEGLG